MDMYIKLTKSKKYTYVQVVEGYRVGEKVKHKVILNLGRVDKLKEDASWEGVLGRLAQALELKNIFDINKSKATETVNWGYLVYKKLWRKFKLHETLSNIRDNGKTSFDLDNACFLMVIQHLLNPRSKLGTYNQQKFYSGYKEVDLNHLYRSLDVLCKNKEAIEKHVFDMNRDLFDMKVDVVFYDVTTFHFESVMKDGLRNFGYSKNCKFNEVQVVLGLFVDCEGRPVGYELFPGNTFDSKTLDNALDGLEKRFGVRNVIIVADRGINSKLNLKSIVDRGYNYIVASRIKNMGKTVQEKIFDQKGYSDLGSDGSRYKVLPYLNNQKNGPNQFTIKENLIITYSLKRAKKDNADRQRLLEKAEHLLSNKSLIKSGKKRGGKKYLKETNETDYVLDVEAILKDSKFDGYYGIQTSDQNLSVEKILNAYHTLWKIEESFRVMKSTLEVRPIFHWTEDRIKGHFVVCFLSFLLERTLEFDLLNNGIRASTADIRSALQSMQFTEIEYGETKYLLTQAQNELVEKILKTMQIKLPKNSIPKGKFDMDKFIS